MGNVILDHSQKVDNKLSIGSEISSNGLPQQQANLLQTSNDEVINQASNSESEPICGTLYLSDHG